MSRKVSRQFAGRHVDIHTVHGLPCPALNPEQLVAKIIEERRPIPYHPKEAEFSGDASPSAPSSNLQPARIVLEVHSDAIKDCKEAIPIPLSNLPYSIEPLFPGADPSDQVFKLANYFVITMPFARSTIRGLGHDLAYSFRNVDGVVRSFYEGTYNKYVPLASVLEGGPVQQDKEWSRRAVRLPQAEGLIGGKGLGGNGIVIGHPDTGWADHPELDQGALDLARQWNTRSQTPDARDPQSFYLFNGHGTSTATVMISGLQPSDIVGVAPQARVLPIRCIQSVVLLLDVEIARGIWYAAQQNVDVISLSVGGHPISYLEGVIGYAIHRKNIIICAAAGQGVPYVVYPAAYKDCIAVAGTTATNRPWKPSSKGPQVTISAPAHNVWVGDFDENKTPIVKPGSGTSYATPHVAAAAAIWLAFHGKQNLLNRYQSKVPLQVLFKHVLRQSANNPGVFTTVGQDADVNVDPGYTWDTTQYGAGILDVHALLTETLPEPAVMEEIYPDDWVHSTYTEIMYGLYHNLDPQKVDARLNKLFEGIGVGVDQILDQFGTEFTHLLMESEKAFHGFGQQLEARAEEAKEKFEQSVDGLKNLIENARVSAEGVVRELEEVARDLTEDTAEALEEVANHAKEVAEQAAAAAEEVARQAAEAAKVAAEAAEAAARAAQEAAQAVAEGVEDAIQDAGETVSNIFKDIFG